MLFLTGAIVGVFVAQDLLLFYVFFEAMLVPLYVLIGAWGGPGRLGATIKFVIYTMAGSLFMLAAIIVFGLQQGTFDLIQSGTSDDAWLFLGFALAFAVKAPLFPLHGWLPVRIASRRPRWRDPLGRRLEGRRLRLPAIAIPKFPGPADDFQVLILVLAATGLACTARCWPSAPPTCAG